MQVSDLQLFWFYQLFPLVPVSCPNDFYRPHWAPTPFTSETPELELEYQERMVQQDDLRNADAPRKAEDKEIVFLSPDEAFALLRTAEKSYPQAVPLYALALFAGIRAEKLIRLETHHVTTDGIELPAQVTKKGRRRHIVPTATLKAWLTKHPSASCLNWRQVDRAVRRLA